MTDRSIMLIAVACFAIVFVACPIGAAALGYEPWLAFLSGIAGIGAVAAGIVVLVRLRLLRRTRLRGPG